MKVGFYLTEGKQARKYYDLAHILVKTIRRTMPKADITQFTDMESERATGIDYVQRLPAGPLSLQRALHYGMEPGEWLFVDTDVTVEADVSDVFHSSFDIAIADRNWTHLPLEQRGSVQSMAYNAGVIFSRSQNFWRDVHRIMRLHPEWQTDWFGDQRVICNMVESEKYNVKILPGMEYNYPPNSAIDQATGAKIVHCKGPRKDWMIYKYLGPRGTLGPGPCPAGPPGVPGVDGMPEKRWTRPSPLPPRLAR